MHLPTLRDRLGTEVWRWPLMVVLVLLLLGMGVHYAVAEPAHQPGPTNAALEADYDRHVGVTIYRWVRVVDVSEHAMVVEDESLVLVVEGQYPEVRPGDAVQVYGTLEANHRLSPRRVVVSSYNRLLYLYLVSGLGATLTLGLFFRSWRFDRDRLVFVPRGDTRA